MYRHIYIMVECYISCDIWMVKYEEVVVADQMNHKIVSLLTY